MQNATVSIEIRNRGENGEEYKAYLAMPATDYEIRDALQQVRAANGEEKDLELVIETCPNMPEAEYRRLDMPRIAELNHLAKRLSALTEDEQIVLFAVTRKYFGQFEEDTLISMKDLINLTYELDEYTVAPISDDAILGQYVIENDLHEDVKAVPFDSRYLLDEKKIGRYQRENNEGVYIGNAYVELKDYKLPEVYDGEDLHAEESKFIFSIKVGLLPDQESASGDSKAFWIGLPVQKAEANEYASMIGAKRIEDCFCLEFESAILQIEQRHFAGLQNFDTLNRLARTVQCMSFLSESKFKAVLEAGNFKTIKEMSEAAQDLRLYDFAPRITDESEYFKEYLRSKLVNGADGAWLNTLTAYKEGAELMLRLGSRSTHYGFISPKGHMLFEYVSRADHSIPMDEKFELISVCDKTALFTNGRIINTQLPDGLYKYELREGMTLPFSSIEESVIVNRGGTVLVKEPLDLGAEGIITFDEETSPNFLGEQVTLGEYLSSDYEQTDREGIQEQGAITQ